MFFARFWLRGIWAEQIGGFRGYFTCVWAVVNRETRVAETRLAESQGLSVVEFPRANYFVAIGHEAEIAEIQFARRRN